MYICLYKYRFAQNPPIYAGYQRLAVLDRLDKMRRHGGRDGLRQCGCGQETLTSQIASNAPDHYRETESELTLSQVNGHAANDLVVRRALEVAGAMFIDEKGGGRPRCDSVAVKELLDCITGDDKPRPPTAHTNTMTIKATATKGKAHVA
jgi:hypothetical protein